MKFKIEVDSKDDDFVQNPHAALANAVGDVMAKMLDRIDMGCDKIEMAVRDVNGNKVGECKCNLRK